MRLTIERSAAHDAMGAVAAVVEKRHTIPVLGHVLLTAKDGALTLQGTDLDSEVQARAAARVEEPGQATAPADRLFEILRNLPAGGDVALSLGPGRLSVTCGRSRFQLPVLSPEDFPTFPDLSAAKGGSVSARGVKQLLDRVLHAVSRNESRPALQGVFLHVAEGKGGPLLKAVATDGHRLACDAMPADEVAWLPPALLPRKAAGELRRMVDGSAGELDLRCDGKLVLAELGDLRIASKLIDYEYPDYPRVIPGDRPEAWVRVKVAELSAAVKRAAIVSTSGKVRSVELKVEPGRLSVQARDFDGGEAEEALEAAVEGEPRAMRFNSAYLMDALALVTDEEVTLELPGPRDHAKVIDFAAPDFVQVIVPQVV